MITTRRLMKARVLTGDCVVRRVWGLTACIVGVVAVLAAGDSAAFPSVREDFALLPEYCSVRYAGRFGLVASDAERAKWKRIFGHDWTAIHHYCSGLDHVNKSRRLIGDEEARQAELGQALKSFDVMIRWARKGSVLLPEILLKKGEVLLELKRASEGVAQFANAIQIRRNYVPAYVALSDYYVTQGEFEEARKVLESGLTYKPQSKILRRRMERFEGDGGNAESVPSVSPP